MRFLKITFIGFLGVVAMSFFVAYQQGIRPFAADFDTGNGRIPQDFPKEMGVEPSIKRYPNLVNFISMVEEPTRNGRYALKITVDPQFQTQRRGRPVKNRTEVNYKHNNVEGSEVWYQWSFLVPEDFKELNPRRHPNSWNIIGQFHAIPDPSQGMKSAAGTNPPIALYLGRQGEKFGVKLNYGIQKKNVGPAGHFEVKKGEWVDFKMHVKWSQTNKGFIRAWANEMPITDGKHFGRNMHNSKPHYWKAGFYRGAGMPYRNTIYIDEFRVGSKEEDVLIN